MQAWIIEDRIWAAWVVSTMWSTWKSVLGHIQNDWYYPEMADKLTHLVYLRSTRTILSTTLATSARLSAWARLLELNGYSDYVVKRFVLKNGKHRK